MCATLKCSSAKDSNGKKSSWCFQSNTLSNLRASEQSGDWWLVGWACAPEKCPSHAWKQWLCGANVGILKRWFFATGPGQPWFLHAGLALRAARSKARMHFLPSHPRASEGLHLPPERGCQEVRPFTFPDSAAEESWHYLRWRRSVFLRQGFCWKVTRRVLFCWTQCKDGNKEGGDRAHGRGNRGKERNAEGRDLELYIQASKNSCEGTSFWVMMHFQGLSSEQRLWSNFPHHSSHQHREFPLECELEPPHPSSRLLPWPLCCKYQWGGVWL